MHMEVSQKLNEKPQRGNQTLRLICCFNKGQQTYVEATREQKRVLALRVVSFGKANR